VTNCQTPLFRRRNRSNGVWTQTTKRTKILFTPRRQATVLCLLVWVRLFSCRSVCLSVHHKSQVSQKRWNMPPSCNIASHDSLRTPVFCCQRSWMNAIGGHGITIYHVCFVCLPVNIYRGAARAIFKVLCMLPIAVARSFSGGVAICYMHFRFYGRRHDCTQ